MLPIYGRRTRMLTFRHLRRVRAWIVVFKLTTCVALALQTERANTERGATDVPVEPAEHYDRGMARANPGGFRANPGPRTTRRGSREAYLEDNSSPEVLIDTRGLG